ncbi:uncharacterized protein LOC123560626 [Mercenaria mercenaria]|uniref:uncharacterized protein LOC123560626 n=1 Tax=Mercenaria mercenaria TaxID=6596 RepID=UPI00234F42A2|nr:uncharacterized protein LOC123560626 [Mercenaria mercenaria]
MIQVKMSLESDGDQSHIEISRSYDKDECAICLDSYRQAKLLPCMHRFCEEPCLKNLADSSQGNTFKCPLCRQEYIVGNSACVGQPESTPIQRSQYINGTIVSPLRDSETAPRLVQNTEELRIETAPARGPSYLWTVPRTRDSNISYSVSEPSTGASCVKICYIGLIVCMVHCVFVGIGRLVTGIIVYDDSLTSSRSSSQVSVAEFQISKGVLDILTALAITRERGRRKVCLAVLVMGSITCLIIGSTKLWKSTCSDTIDDFANGFMLFSRYYSIFDWIMTVYLVVFGCYYGADTNN